MSDTQKQALQRFIATAIALLLGVGATLLASPEFAAFITSIFAGDSILGGLFLLLIPPLVTWIGKLQAGATEKAPDTTVGDVRSTVPPGKAPGLFG